MYQEKRCHQHVHQLEKCNRQMFGDLIVTRQTIKQCTIIKSQIQTPTMQIISTPYLISKKTDDSNSKRKTSILVEKLLDYIYHNENKNQHHVIRRESSISEITTFLGIVDVETIKNKDNAFLESLIGKLRVNVERIGEILLRNLKRRDALRSQQESHCDVITGQLMKYFEKNEKPLQFSIHPGTSDSGFAQWLEAMKMVAQLSDGIPPEFRRQLWLTLAERHLTSRHVDWMETEQNCFSEWSNCADTELGVQIVKDLHRTGCSLFCGENGQENQVLLKRVLLAYARWNKSVGYCQGFNMLAALILQVTDKCEPEALKLMIYLIEGVLPDSYFADSLRGLSVDMAVFRELLRTRLPSLSFHLDSLQNASRDGTTNSYEPPLTNVFTMQWFLTLFCNCLPQQTVLRIWDLIMLEGNEILLRTALAIWQTLAKRILLVRSADEFYSTMGTLTHELFEHGIIDTNTLISAIVEIGSLYELPTLRDHYLYNINPWAVHIAPPNSIENDERRVSRMPYRRSSTAVNVLDIATLKNQYAKLRQRQRQAHVIFSAAFARQPNQIPNPSPVAMNHLLLGKNALVPSRRSPGPIPGSIPPTRVESILSTKTLEPSENIITLSWKDTPKYSGNDSSSSSSDTELCDDHQSIDEGEDDGDHVDDFKKEQVTNRSEDSPIDNSMNNSFGVVEKESDKDNISEIIENATSLTFNDLIKCDEFYDENVDFQKFLEDRVQCIKINTSVKEEENEDEYKGRSKHGRRNSEKALQIIQENSVILHRIMQCQSRLSPPLTSLENCSLEELQSCPQYKVKNEKELVENCYQDVETDKNKKKSQEYGSKYTSILEKSKNLNEKYRNLILNSTVSNLDKFTENSETINLSSKQIVVKNTIMPKEDEIYSKFEDYSSNTIRVVPDSLSGRKSDLYKNILDTCSPSSSKSSSPEFHSKSSIMLKEPFSIENRIDYFEEKDEAKLTLETFSGKMSPNKVFNPFPVSLSSRQSKEVPLKLGMYKK